MGHQLDNLLIDRKMTTNITFQNASEGPKKTPPYDPMMKKSILISEIALILVLNGVVITGYLRMKKNIQRKNPNFLLLNQSTIDSLIGFATLGRVICGKCRPPDELDITRFLTEFCMFLAVGFLLLCTIERYFCIQAPFRHRRYATRKNIVTAIAVLWMLMTIPAFYFTFAVDMKVDKTIKEYFRGITTILLMFMISVYVLLVLTYRAITKSMQVRMSTVKQLTAAVIHGSISNNAQSAIVKQNKKHVKLTKLFILMASVYTFTILPYVFGSLVVDSFDVEFKVIAYTKTVTFFFYLSSSFINPILTLIFKVEFKRALCRRLSDMEITDTSVVTNASTVL